MVKFTFGSAFLIFASVFALVSAIPAASLYQISSVQTGGVIFSDGTEKAGDKITTIPSSQANSDNSLLIIDPPLAIGPNSFTVTVQGNAGLYIAVSDEPVGQYLFWSKNQYWWDFLLQSTGNYVVSVIGQYSVWFGDADLDNFLAVGAYRDARQSQIFFSVTDK